MRSDDRAYTYTWSARNQMLSEWTEGAAVREFSYDAAGRMIEATVFTLTTRFTYNGLGARVAVEVVGQETTTFTLDYAAMVTGKSPAGFFLSKNASSVFARILVEATLAGAVHYLYGRECLGELRDDEWLYYLNDATGYVRQGVDDQEQVVSGWLFDPDGVVLEGPEGPVSHLVCGGVYDWSTGLIYKGGRYFDPMLGIWLALMPLVVVQSWRGRKKRRGFPWYMMVLLVMCVSGTLAACCPGEIPTLPTPSPDSYRICVGLFPPDGVDADTRYEAYGFVLGGFEDENEVRWLGTAIHAYGDQLGGPQQLANLMSPSPKPVCRAGASYLAGAGEEIWLGDAAFSLKLGWQSQIAYVLMDEGDDVHAQVVFGHELGHLLISASRHLSEEDWVGKYREMTSFDWGDAGAVEEEAVTSLAHYVLDSARGENPAYWNLDRSRWPKITEWCGAFLEALKK